MKNIPIKWFSLLGLLAVFSHTAVADDYADARAELVAAYQAQDYGAMVDAATAALNARPEYPGALFNLAFAEALNDQPENALLVLDILLGKGIDFGVADMEVFAAVRELDAWTTYEAGLERLNQPVGEASVALQLEDGNFVPEGIAIGPDDEYYIGSIRKGQLIRVADEVELLSDRAGHWSVFGMRFDDQGDLWFASAAVAQLENVGDAAGSTGLFRLDTQEGTITRAAVLPQNAEQQVLGDLIIVGDAIYTTDSLTGAIYRYDIEADRFATLVAPGVLGSPQGLVLDQRGKHLYVADYIGGLYRVAIEDGALERLHVPHDINDYGIDGLYRHNNELIAIQNGSRPHRVVAFQLGADGTGIGGMRTLVSNHALFDEPTLGVVQGDEFLFVANSHWNRFDQEHGLPEGLSGPIILKVSITSQ